MYACWLVNDNAYIIKHLHWKSTAQKHISRQPAMITWCKNINSRCTDNHVRQSKSVTVSTDNIFCKFCVSDSRETEAIKNERIQYAIVDESLHWITNLWWCKNNFHCEKNWAHLLSPSGSYDRHVDEITGRFQILRFSEDWVIWLLYWWNNTTSAF